MKKVFILITVFFISNYAFAQTICDRDLAKGMDAFKKENYSEAKKYFDHARKQNCSNADFKDWIKKCDDKIRATQTKQQHSVTIASSQPTACDILINQGKEKYDSENYEEAKTLFTTAGGTGCSAANDWLKKCEEKIKEIQCENDINNGIFYYNKQEYEMALTYFESAVKNGCSGADEGLQKSKAHVAEMSASLDLAEIRRMINLNVGSNTTQSFPDGNYKGEIYNAQREGKGIYIWPSGAIYIGEFHYVKEFQNSVQSGAGIYMVQDGGYTIPNCPDCAFYVGAWENGKKQGIGSCYDESGKLIYSGNFVNNMPADNYPSSNNDSSYKFKIIKNSNGYTYCGETKFGKSNGLGIEVDNSGNIKFGNWKDGQLYGSYINISKNGGVEKIN